MSWRNLIQKRNFSWIRGEHAAAIFRSSSNLIEQATSFAWSGRWLKFFLRMARQNSSGCSEEGRKSRQAAANALLMAVDADEAEAVIPDRMSRIDGGLSERAYRTAVEAAWDSAVEDAAPSQRLSEAFSRRPHPS